MSEPASPLFGRDAALEKLSEQIDQIFTFFKADVAKVHQHNKDMDARPPIGFLVYKLKTLEGKSLTEEYMRKFDLTLPSLEKTRSYETITEYCTVNKLECFFDYYLNYSDPNPERYVRIVINGMDS